LDNIFRDDIAEVAMAYFANSMQYVAR